MEEDDRQKRDPISEGLRQGLGILSAVRDALEETIEEARQRGDISQERARELFRSAMGRAQEAAEEARNRMDLPTRKEVDSLTQRVEAVERRLRSLEEGEARPSGGGTEEGTGEA